MPRRRNPIVPEFGRPEPGWTQEEWDEAMYAQRRKLEASYRKRVAADAEAGIEHWSTPFGARLRVRVLGRKTFKGVSVAVGRVLGRDLERPYLVRVITTKAPTAPVRVDMAVHCTRAKAKELFRGLSMRTLPDFLHAFLP